VKKDEANAAAGKPTRYFETFVQTTRSFSPEVSARIDQFIDTHEYGASQAGEPVNPIAKKHIEAALPE
jgi:hypothetical protein